MQTIPLSEIFDFSYGTKLDLNKMNTDPLLGNSVNFVGRSANNNGVVARVARLRTVEPLEAGLITVALGGALLSSFVQETEFYTAQNVAVLKPLMSMTRVQKVFYCIAIKKNEFRYSAFGREANRTLRSLAVPTIDEIPSWISEDGLCSWDDLISSKPLSSPSIELKQDYWKPFHLSSLFEIKKGKRLTKAEMTKGGTPFVGASDKHNGHTTLIGQSAIHDAGTISVSYNGSVGEAFFQPKPFWASDDVNVLYPKGFELNCWRGLFLCSLIKMERYRFNYGRKWHLERMRNTNLRLPSADGVTPDWDFIDRFMQTLRYSELLDRLQKREPGPTGPGRLARV